MEKDILDISIRDLLLTVDSTNNNKFGKFNEKMVSKYFKDGNIDLDMVVELLTSVFDFRTMINGTPSKKEINLLTYLSSYEKYSTSGRIPKEHRDWNTIKTINELVEIIDEIDEKVKKEELEKKSRKFYDTEDWLIIQPLSFESSRKYGRNTKWCTTEAESSFLEYATGDRELFYVINKKTNYKVAINFKKEYPDDIDFYCPEDLTHDFFYFIQNNLLDITVVGEIKKTIDTLINEYEELLKEDERLSNLNEKYQEVIEKYKPFTSYKNGHYDTYSVDDLFDTYGDYIKFPKFKLD